MMQVKAPAGWQPEDALQRPVNTPPVHSRFRKFDLYRSVEQFERIDSHAIQVGLCQAWFLSPKTDYD